jgi:hypothetical protein
MSPNTKVSSNDTPDLVVKESESPSTYEKDLLHDSSKTTDSSNDEKTDNIILKQSTTPISSRLDRFLSKYGTFSGSTFTADQGIKILQWSSWAISYATTKSSNVTISPSLRKLYNELSMARYVLRFYGMLQSLEGYRSGSWAGGSWDNPLIAKIAKYIMAGSMLAYYPLEHVAYAGWQMPKLVKVNANKISAISCCFWTAYIVGDFWVSCLKWKELKMKLSDIGDILSGKKNMRKDGNTDGGDGSKEENVVSFILCDMQSCIFSTFFLAVSN